MAANAVAPFILCGRLRPALAATEEDPRWGHIINVSALEGKFSVGKKGSGHPHTNMAKAALNMLTCTSATALSQEKVLINCVDTGWVTDMAPGGHTLLEDLGRPLNTTLMWQVSVRGRRLTRPTSAHHWTRRTVRHEWWTRSSHTCSTKNGTSRASSGRTTASRRGKPVLFYHGSGGSLNWLDLLL